ncbi:multiple sugar transport system substrate-binding protein [Paenibacillus sp. DS2015]|uniref:sugar ABC transporter substrate-binding protein n=1 Tax=Paenibacillus sp. DS2015 TaxID=3373917 RepID=UPI003D1C7DBF
MKKSLKLMLAVLLTFSIVLAGCSSNNTSKDGDKVLKVWIMGEGSKNFQEIAKPFEEQNPGLKVEVQAIPWGSAHDKLLTAIASKSGPDVVQMGTTWVPEFGGADVLLDLTSYLEQYPNLNKENFYEGSVDTMSVNDKIVGIPWYVETRALYYRTDLLAEVGYPEGPKTWDELKDAGKKLVANGEGKYAIPIDAKDANYLAMYAYQNGSKLIDENREAQLNQPEFQESIEFLKSLYDEGLTPTGSDRDIFAAFKDGTFPMFISGPWMIASVKEKAPEIDGKWAIAVLPAEKTNTSFMGGANLSVFNFSKNQDEAVKFISYMTDKETQLKWYDLGKDLPSVTEAWSDSRLADPLIATFGEQLKNAKPVPFVKEWEEISQAIIASFEEITVGGVDVKTELDKLNQKATEILNKQ